MILFFNFGKSFDWHFSISLLKISKFIFCTLLAFIWNLKYLIYLDTMSLDFVFDNFYSKKIIYTQ